MFSYFYYGDKKKHQNFSQKFEKSTFLRNKFLFQEYGMNDLKNLKKSFTDISNRYHLIQNNFSEGKCFVNWSNT